MNNLTKDLESKLREDYRRFSILSTNLRILKKYQEANRMKDMADYVEILLRYVN